MKKAILNSILFFLFVPIFLFGQITTTNATFPSPGDIWGIAVDSAVLLSGITAPSSTAVTWDFNAGVGSTSHLEEQIHFDEIIKMPSEGSVPDSFPTSDVLIPLLGGEGYFKTNGNSMEAIGFHGDPFGLLGADVTIPFSDPITLYNAPMTYGDNFKDTGEFYTEIDGSIIPPGQFPTTVDSLTVLYKTEVNDTIDAFGTLITPSGTYDVLRMSRVEYRYTEVFAKIPVFGWVDASAYVPQLGNDTVWTWIYKDAVTSQNIVEIDLEWRGTTIFSPTTTTRDARWLIPPTSVSTFDFQKQTADIKVYPNPAMNYVNFEFNDIQAGNYQINVYNVLGRLEKSESHYLSSDATIYTDVSDLSKGAYIYNIQNEAGQTLATKRLLVTKP